MTEELRAYRCPALFADAPAPGSVGVQREAPAERSQAWNPTSTAQIAESEPGLRAIVSDVRGA